MKKTVAKFLAKFKGSPAEINLSKYKDKDFCNNLTKEALNQIHGLLIRMHTQQLKEEQGDTLFYLKNVINYTDYTNKLTCLDYCVLAGLDDLALRFAAIGCKSQQDIDLMRDIIVDEFKDDRPKMLDDVLKTIKKINDHYKNNEAFFVKNEPSLWQKAKDFLWKNKYAVFMICTGVGCILTAPFSGGLSTILLLSIGIPLCLGSVGSLQSSTSNQASRDQVSEQGRIFHEAKEIRDLIKLTRKKLAALKKTAHQDNYIDDNECVVNKAMMEGASKQHSNAVLFVLGKKDEFEINRENKPFKLIGFS